MSKDRPKRAKHQQPTSPTRSKHAHHSPSHKRAPVSKPPRLPPNPPPSPPPSSPPSPPPSFRDKQPVDLERGRDYEQDSPVVVFLAGLLGFAIGLLLGLIIALFVSVFVCCCFYDARPWWRNRKKRAFLIGFILGILVAIVIVVIVALAVGVRRDRDVVYVPYGTPATFSRR